MICNFCFTPIIPFVKNGYIVAKCPLCGYEVSEKYFDESNGISQRSINLFIKIARMMVNGGVIIW